jgi:hypothetical protein
MRSAIFAMPQANGQQCGTPRILLTTCRRNATAWAC